MTEIIKYHEKEIFNEQMLLIKKILSINVVVHILASKKKQSSEKKYDLKTLKGIFHIMT